MEIRSSLTNRSNQVLDVIYRDAEDDADFGDRKISAVHAYCFYGSKLVIVYSAQKGYWSPPGGGVEAGESVQDATIREIREETNMRVIKQRLIGYQDIFEPTRVVSQARLVCLVEPVDSFVADPDGDVAEIKLIEPDAYRDYFDWGIIGDHLMTRAMELKGEL